MFPAIPFALILLAFLILQMRQAQWSLFESLVTSAAIGHALVLPVAYAIKEHFDSERIFAISLLALALAAAMGFGAVWTFRNLAIINERRPLLRLLYLALGLLFVPSVLAFPFNLLFGWGIWLPLMSLNGAAACVQANAEHFRRIAEVKALFNPANARAERANVARDREAA